VSCSTRRLPFLLWALLTGVPQGLAWDHHWLIVTLARNGSWGAASNSSQSQAIAETTRSCREMAGTSGDCGAQFMAARNGRIIANLCGDHKVIATGSSLISAEQEALNREISLQLSYVPDLPPCKRIVTVDPSGAIVPLNQRNSSARAR